MSIQYGITSPKVDDLMEVIRNFPDLAEKHYTPVIQRDVKIAEASIKGGIPRGATSEAANSFGSKVSGRGFNVRGWIGWFDRDDPYYPNVLEYGSRDHSISSGASIRGRKTIFEMGRGTVQRGAGEKGTHIKVGGAWKTVTTVKGIAARKFMASGFEAATPAIELDMYMANEAILAEFAAI